MHRKNPISLLVYNALFPTPTPSDPPSFSAHLSKNLVGEVRIETATFYGSLDTIEARYPGLNYAHAPHRKRLGRFPHHKKLFEAFDRLGLTDSEIQGFCRWEGTLWARERYERDEGVRVRDTTGIEIGEWVDRRRRPLGRNSLSGRGGIGSKGREINVKTDIEVEIEDVGSSSANTNTHNNTQPSLRRPTHPHTTQNPDTEMQDDALETEDEDDDLNPNDSVGFALNERLLHAAALRDRGLDVAMDPEWEQYLKEAQERGELVNDATRDTREALRIMAGQLARMGGGGGSGEGSSSASAAASVAAAAAEAARNSGFEPRVANA